MSLSIGMNELILFKMVVLHYFRMIVLSDSSKLIVNSILMVYLLLTYLDIKRPYFLQIIYVSHSIFVS